MSSSSALERTIDKVLSQKEAELISQLDKSYQDSIANLESSRGKLESEYTRIADSAKKQAENLRRQIIGSSRLAARNNELVIIEDAVNEAFSKARERLASSNKVENYRALVSRMLEEGISSVASKEVSVECNRNDFELVKQAIANLDNKYQDTRVRLSDSPIDVIGGVRVKSADGSMTFDNTLDSRIERLKPLIRKNIAQMLRSDSGKRKSEQED